MNNKNTVSILGRNLFIPRKIFYSDETYERILHHINKLADFINESDSILYVFWREGLSLENFEWTVYGYQHGRLKTESILEQEEKARIKRYKYGDVYKAVRDIFHTVLDYIKDQEKLTIHSPVYDCNNLYRLTYAISWPKVEEINPYDTLLHTFVDIDYEAELYTTPIPNKRFKTCVGFTLGISDRTLFIPVFEQEPEKMKELPDRFLDLYFRFLRAKKKEAEKIMADVTSLENKLDNELRLLYESNM